MLLALDTHVHLYDCYNLDEALGRGAENLQSSARGVREQGADVLGLCLVERRGQAFFNGLQQRALHTGPSLGVSSSPDGTALLLSSRAFKLYVFPGRQIVSSEKIEILGMFLSVEISDGLPARETMRRIVAAGGLPVLSWAPGKWWFKRGRVVRDILNEESPGGIFVGDTSLRPPIWPEPRLHALARKRGIRLLYGSDPLPFAGEETLIGSYATLLEAPFDSKAPGPSVRAALLQHDARIFAGGRRSSLRAMVQRIRENQKVRTA